MKLVLRLGATTAMLTGLLSADATYVTTTKFEGGTLVESMQKMSAMPMMGRLKQAFEDQRYDVYVKGNKMAHWGQLTSTIYDLDAGTVTAIDNKKHSYYTATFEEMQQRAEEMQQRMSRNQKVDLDFDIKIENTGQTRTVEGQTAKEMLITMTAKEATAQGQMVIKTHAWVVPFKPASKEVTEFQRKLGAKYAYAFSSLGPGMASAGKGMSAAMKEASKQEGFAALSEIEISGVAAAAGPMAVFGGGKSDPNAPMLKLLTESGQFSDGAVDDSKFVVPAGYKEDKHQR